MYYTIYKITNLINNKEYIGAHKTKKLDDGYMGSGTHIKCSVSKYGTKCFYKEIIFRAGTEDIMYWVEKMLVDRKYVDRKDTYNQKEGGESSFRDINKRKLNLYGKNKENFLKYAQPKGVLQQKWLRENDEEWVEKTNKNVSLSCKLFFENGGINGFKDKHHSEETKKKIGEKNSKHQVGTGNSQFGTIWIYNLDIKLNKKIKKEELPNFEKIGWLKGRKMKF